MSESIQNYDYISYLSSRLSQKSTQLRSQPLLAIRQSNAGFHLRLHCPWRFIPGSPEALGSGGPLEKPIDLADVCLRFQVVTSNDDAELEMVMKFDNDAIGGHLDNEVAANYPSEVPPPSLTRIPIVQNLSPIARIKVFNNGTVPVIECQSEVMETDTGIGQDNVAVRIPAKDEAAVGAGWMAESQFETRLANVQ
jgi:hypothetical protein